MAPITQSNHSISVCPCRPSCLKGKLSQQPGPALLPPKYSPLFSTRCSPLTQPHPQSCRGYPAAVGSGTPFTRFPGCGPHTSPAGEPPTSRATGVLLDLSVLFSVGAKGWMAATVGLPPPEAGHSTPWADRPPCLTAAATRPQGFFSVPSVHRRRHPGPGLPQLLPGSRHQRSDPPADLMLPYSC